MRLTNEEYEELKVYRPDLAAYLKVGEKLFAPNVPEGSVENGYKGRIGLYEVLEITESIRKIIMAGADTDQIYNEARRQGLKLIVEDGVEKLR